MARVRRKREVKKEYKAFPATIVNVDEAEGVIEAIVSVLGNIDDGDDIIHKGSFTKTIVERARRVRVLDQHRTDTTGRVIGIPLEMREVGRDELPPQILAEYPDAVGGLYTKTKYLLETEAGRETFIRIKEGAIDEYSIGFDIVQQDWSSIEKDGKKIPIRNIREVRLWEYSPVIWGMNPATTTVSVKDWQGDQPQMLLGDAMAARVHRLIISQASVFYEDGYLSMEEYLMMNELASNVLNMVIAEIPEDVRMRPMQTYYWFDGDGAEEMKDQPIEDDEKQAAPTPAEADMPLHVPTEEVESRTAEEEGSSDSEKLLKEIQRGLVEIELSELAAI